MWNDFNWTLWYLIWYPDKAFREPAVCLEDMMDNAGFSEVIVIEKWQRDKSNTFSVVTAYDAVSRATEFWQLPSTVECD